MITGELQLVSLGFEAAGVKAPFLSHRLRGAEAPLFHGSAGTVLAAPEEQKPDCRACQGLQAEPRPAIMPVPPLPTSSARVPGPPIGRSRSPPPPPFRPHTQSPPSGQRPCRNFHAKL